MRQLADMALISNCTESSLNSAADSLRAGNLVAFPTETVYGLGADAENKDAVARVFKVKNRPKDHPLIIHISSVVYLDKWAKQIPDYAIMLAKKFWPGPMTLILPRTGLAKNFITGGQDKVGIRVPGHSDALLLLKKFESKGGLGIAAPSANRFGKVSPTTASAVASELVNYLNENDQILDSGLCSIGIESTIIDCTEIIPTILRPGAISAEMIESTIGISNILNISSAEVQKTKASGLLITHYAPNAKVILDGSPTKGNGLIALASIPTPEGVVRLASPKNSEEYARILYHAFRAGDLQGINEIYVIAPSGSGIEIAINDRIKKSSYLK
jgi:L-threonylcarbamoyladenylate synthase